jgi:hypothetical protein
MRSFERPDTPAQAHAAVAGIFLVALGVLGLLPRDAQRAPTSRGASSSAMTQRTRRSSVSTSAVRDERRPVLVVRS